MNPKTEGENHTPRKNGTFKKSIIENLTPATGHGDAESPSKLKKSYFRSRIFRRMKGWCNFGFSDDECCQPSHLPRAGPKTLRSQTRDLFDWKCDFESAVGDAGRVSSHGDGQSFVQGNKAKQVQARRGRAYRSKSAPNCREAKKISIKRSKSESDLDHERNSLLVRFLGDLVRSRNNLKRSASAPNMMMKDDDAKGTLKNLSLPDLLAFE